MKTQIIPSNILLEILFQHKGQFVSGEKIATQLGVTRAAVHKKVEKLRNQGFIIDAVSKQGIRLNNEQLPYSLIQEQIQCLKNPLVPALFFTECTSSTNTLAKFLVHEHEQFFVIAREQTAGRGRIDRIWESQSDKDVILSFASLINVSITQFFNFIRMASVSVHQTLNQFGVPCKIKWPNDIITNDGKKICGILTESINEEQYIKNIIIGIGINVNSIDLPEYADSIKNILGYEIDINEFIAQLINNIYDLWTSYPENIRCVTNYWYKHLAWINEEVIFYHNNRKIIGKLCLPKDDGSLVLEINGDKQEFYTGDLINVSLRKQ